MRRDMLKWVSIVIAVGIIFCTGVLIHSESKPTVEPNQVWVYSRYDENPYEVTELDTMTVLNTKSGYVLYELRGDTLNNRESLFVFEAKRIK